MSKELYDQVRSELEQETPEVAKVKSILKKLENEEIEMIESLRFANTESKKRKEKIRDELNPKIEELSDKILELEKRNNTEELESELTELKKYKTTVLDQNKKNFITKFSTISKHPNFEKAKEKFTLPEPDDKGEYDFAKQEDDTIQKNSETLTFLESLDYFKTQEKKTKTIVDGDRFKDAGDEHEEKPKFENRADRLQYLKEQLEKQEQ
jgi:hypothetical protein